MKKVIVMMIAFVLCGICEISAKSHSVSVIVTGNVSSELKDVVNAQVMQRVSGNPDYHVFERNDSFLSALMKEQDYQLSGEVSEDEIRTVGKRAGVDYVVAVNVLILSDGKCMMSARLIDIVSGRVLKTCNNTRDFDGSDTIIAMANNIAYRMFSKNSK